MSSSHSIVPPLLRSLAIVIATTVVATCGATTVSPSPSVSTEAPTDAPVESATAEGGSLCDLESSAPPAQPAPWWRERVFYEVFVRSFADSDGDGIGDLRGLTERLDYLNDGDPSTTDDLGVTGLWLMPIAESPSYHGYDVTDYRRIEADYGTAEDFREFMAAARERGIAVIVDLVLNHTSIDHPWFQDARTPGSEHDDWYLWSTTGVPFAGPGGQRVWHKDGDRWYYGFFWEGMPDLNVANPDVISALDGVARFWLDDMGVDGFRLDAARHLIEDGDRTENSAATFEWLEDFRNRLKADHPDALVLGEVFDATSMSSKYVREGSLDLTFDFGLAGATIAAIRSSDGVSLRAAQREVAESYPPDGLATFLTNHDQNRIADQLGSDVAATKLAASILLTSQGIPFIYYGEEIGMTGHKPDELIRTPMRWDATTPAAGFSSGTPWEPLSGDPPEVNVASEEADPDSLLSTYRALISLRTDHPALSHGDWTPIEASIPSVNAYLRQEDGETIAVAVNLTDEPIGDLTLTLETEALCGSPAARSLLGPAEVQAPTITSTGGFDAWVPVDALGPREAVVIELVP
jgi:glycosidase